MEPSQLLFNAVESLTTPILLLEQGASAIWTIVYANGVMKQFLNDETDTLPDALQTLMLHYSDDLHTVHDFEFSGAIYDLHCHQSGSQVLLCFAPVAGDFFQQVTLSDLGSSCSAIVIVLDEQGQLADANECFLNFTGKKKSEIMGHSFFAEFIPGDTQKLNSYLKEITTHSSYHQNFITPIKNAKGEMYRINWQVSRMVRHEKTYIVAIGSDISRLIKRQDDMMRQLTAIKVGFNYFPYAVAYANHQGIITSMNIRFKKLFGIKESGIHFDKIALFKKHIGFEAMAANIALIKETSYTFEYHQGDSSRRVRVDIRLLADKHELPPFYVIVVRPLA